MRKKRTRTFMDAAGMIATEEYWEEEVVEGAAADASDEAAAPKPKAKARPAAPAETKPKKKSKKAAGTRDIMSFFGKK